MNKKEAIVDTCFFNKLSCDGKDIETFKRVLADLDFFPVVHPYIAMKELDVFPNFSKLVDEGFVRVFDVEKADLLESYADMTIGEILDLGDTLKDIPVCRTFNAVKDIRFPGA